MQVANVKQRQIWSPRVGKIWACTPQNRTYRGLGEHIIIILTDRTEVLSGNCETLLLTDMYLNRAESFIGRHAEGFADLVKWVVVRHQFRGIDLAGVY